MFKQRIFRIYMKTHGSVFNFEDSVRYEKYKNFMESLKKKEINYSELNSKNLKALGIFNKNEWNNPYESRTKKEVCESLVFFIDPYKIEMASIKPLNSAIKKFDNLDILMYFDSISFLAKFREKVKKRRSGFLSLGKVLSEYIKREEGYISWDESKEKSPQFKTISSNIKIYPLYEKDLFDLKNFIKRE